MERVTYDLFAMFRDIAALLLLLGNFPLLVLTIAEREPSNKGIVKAGCYLVIVIAGLLTNGRGIFPSRWPAVIMLLLTIGFWAFIRWAKTRMR